MCPPLFSVPSGAVPHPDDTRPSRSREAGGGVRSREVGSSAGRTYLVLRVAWAWDLAGLSQLPEHTEKRAAMHPFSENLLGRKDLEAGSSVPCANDLS